MLVTSVSFSSFTFEQCRRAYLHPPSVCYMGVNESHTDRLVLIPLSLRSTLERGYQLGVSTNFQAGATWFDNPAVCLSFIFCFFLWVLMPPSGQKWINAALTNIFIILSQTQTRNSSGIFYIFVASMSCWSLTSICWIGWLPSEISWSSFFMGTLNVIIKYIVIHYAMFYLASINITRNCTARKGVTWEVLLASSKPLNALLSFFLTGHSEL